MLTFQDAVGAGMARRQFLRVGSLALGGLTLSDLCAARALAKARQLPVRDKSVIFLFMHGGPSQFETFDPKMEAPSGIRSTTGEVKTTLPGVTFGGTFQKLARRADKLAVVRSFYTGDANHDIKPVVGRDTMGANMGSLYARVAGPLRAAQNISSRFIMLSMITGKVNFPTPWSQDFRQPTVGLKRVLSDLAPVSRTDR